MREPMRLLQVLLGILAVLIVTALLGMRLLIWWGHSTPRRPSGLPANAVWVPGPPVVLDLSRRGDWLGCSVEGSHNRCVVTQANGTVEYEGLFSPLSGTGPVPEERLRFSAKDSGELWVWLNQDSKNVPVVRLQDGTVLLPVNGYEELKAWLERVGSKNP
jgi:hypothetical protein